MCGECCRVMFGLSSRESPKVRFRIRPTADLQNAPAWIEPGRVYAGHVDLLAGGMFNRQIVLEHPEGAEEFLMPERDLETVTNG